MRIALFAAALLALSPPALAAEAFSWSGTYEGFFVCDDVTDGAGGTFGRAMTMAVVQSENRIDMRNTVAVDPAGPPSHTTFTGRVATGPGGAVSGYLEACASTFPHREMIRLAPASPARQPFGFTADTIFVSDAVPGVHGLVVESCRWSLTRVSAEVAAFQRCP